MQIGFRLGTEKRKRLHKSLLWRAIGVALGIYLVSHSVCSYAKQCTSKWQVDNAERAREIAKKVVIERRPNFSPDDFVWDARQDIYECRWSIFFDSKRLSIGQHGHVTIKPDGALIKYFPGMWAWIKTINKWGQSFIIVSYWSVRVTRVSSDPYYA